MPEILLTKKPESQLRFSPWLQLIEIRIIPLKIMKNINGHVVNGCVEVVPLLRITKCKKPFGCVKGGVGGAGVWKLVRKLAEK